MGYLSEFRKRKRAAIDKGAETMAISIFATEQGKDDPSCWEEDGVMKTLPCLPMMEAVVRSNRKSVQGRLKDVIRHISDPKTVIINEKGERFVLDANECKQLNKLWKDKIAAMRLQASAQ